MRRLVALLALVLAPAMAQSGYVGGHIGPFGLSIISSSGFNPPLRDSFHSVNGGIYWGVVLGPGMPEVRLGVDFTIVFLAVIADINADVLLPLSPPGTQVQPYLGGGANVWFLGDFIGFVGNLIGSALHATFGVRTAIRGTSLAAFVEVQPGYASSFGSFGGNASVNAFFYYVKLGFNYGL